MLKEIKCQCYFEKRRSNSCEENFFLLRITELSKKGLPLCFDIKEHS